MILEFTDSSIIKERNLKHSIYATANIKEYWIVNLVDTCIAVYKNPKKDTYTSKSTFYKGDEIELENFKVKTKVSDILK